MARLRIGSRGSKLALWQAEHVAGRLRGRGHEVEIRVIKTTGDKVLDVALAKVGTKGMFTKEIEEALTAREVDLAVHSLKDLPTELEPGFTLAALLSREDARDVLVSAKYSQLADLPGKARVGTSSLRRHAQLAALRPDVQITSVRGNVDTRLRKLADGDYDAIVLAHAGLLRLGLTQDVREIFSAEQMCPAAGQGALAVEIRSGDAATREAISFLDDPAARATTTCERACLNGLGGGCQVPIGAHATLDGSALTLQAVVASPGGERIIRAQHVGTVASAERLGASTAADLLARGASEILKAVYDGVASAPQQP